MEDRQPIRRRVSAMWLNLAEKLQDRIESAIKDGEDPGEIVELAKCVEECFLKHINLKLLIEQTDKEDE